MPFSIRPIQSFSAALDLARDVRRIALADTCVACGAIRVGSFPLCAGCRRGLVPVTPEDLELAAAPWPEISGITALWHMERGTSARAVIHALKYRMMPRVGRPIGARIAREPGLPVEAVVVPIPLHRTRLRERGYNQAATIAQGLVGARPAYILCEALRRTRASGSQTTRDRAGRAAANHHAFETVGDAVEGRIVVLVDDVFTTGATAASATRSLLDAGASRVHVAVAGLTTARRSGFIGSR
jgi:ComF family protein